MLIISSVGFAKNLVNNASFESKKNLLKSPLAFEQWHGWKYYGNAEFEHSIISHKGSYSALLIGIEKPKIRLWQTVSLKPGRYKINAFLRGLDINQGRWGRSTEFMFNDKYFHLNKRGNFNWSKLEYITELKEPQQVKVSFGLLATGYLWIDDVQLEKVSDETPITAQPVIFPAKTPIIVMEKRHSQFACPRCGYKNTFSTNQCYACGHKFNAPAIGNKQESYSHLKLTETATYSKLSSKPLEIKVPVNWQAFDNLTLIIHSKHKDIVNLHIDIFNEQSKDYTTRVNLVRYIHLGDNKLIIPLEQLYSGDKSRPGSKFKLNEVKKIKLYLEQNSTQAIILNTITLYKDNSIKSILFKGLHAFDFGTSQSPLMPGFTRITPATIFNPGRGYGFKQAKIWRAVDALQPDPLYQDYIAIESGDFIVDLPNDNYRVTINLDSPSTYWGRYQSYHQRQLYAQGKPVVNETVDYIQFKRNYFHYWDTEDLPSDNTFDKYQIPYFNVKTFDVTVTNQRLTLNFNGKHDAISLSFLIIYPLHLDKQGEKFQQWLLAKRRYYFDNAFKRLLYKPANNRVPASLNSNAYLIFSRSIMQDVYYNDIPSKNEIVKSLETSSFAGLSQSLSFSIYPLKNLDLVSLHLSDLASKKATLKAENIDIGFVSYRISRISMDGNLYTIKPRIIIPTNQATIQKGLTRRFWLTIHVPENTPVGIYRGVIIITPEHGKQTSLPIQVKVRKGKILAADIPIGPFGGEIITPGFKDSAQRRLFDDSVYLKSLLMLRKYGFNLFSGIPKIDYNYKNDKITLDFSNADTQMVQAKKLGFVAINSYGAGLKGINPYYPDLMKMKQAGFNNYRLFIQTIYQEIKHHALENNWLDMYWILADEPPQSQLPQAIKNAKAYKQHPSSKLLQFTGATSYYQRYSQQANFKLAKSLDVVMLNKHTQKSITELTQNNIQWGFYNQSSRWTFGEYLYKATTRFKLKFRIAWHWNMRLGNPFYALDSREDDYAWVHVNPEGQLMPEVDFMRLAMGLVDYRLFLTLQHLIDENPHHPQAQQAQHFIKQRLAKFKLGQVKHDKLYSNTDWQYLREKLSNYIEKLITSTQ